MKINNASTFLIVKILVVFLAFPSLAQQGLLNKLSSYKSLVDEFPIEKIHIHTNQPFYNASDTIWLKAYVINANLNRPSTVSNTLMIELIDAEGKMIRQNKLLLNVGLADGYINLSDTLKSGGYQIRAYTNGLKNFGSEFYYKRKVNISNGNDVLQTKASQKFNVQIFPEGGELVTGLSSTVGFKAIGEDGLGIEVKGNIVDDKGKTVASFASESLGMGRFIFTPEINRKYFVNITSAQGNSLKIEIPTAKQNGHVLSVMAKEDSISLNIAVAKDLINSKVILIASQDGIVRHALKKTLASNSNSFSIDNSIFYTGLVQFTLFNAESIPVAERLIFCNHHNLLNIGADLRSAYKKREKVELLAHLKDMEGNSDIGSLSVSVYSEDEYPFNEEDEQSIYADLLLMSDLKGYIEKPNSYFMKSDANNALRLDNLLLTQGWRRFSWKEQLSTSIPVAEKKVVITDKIQGIIKLSNGKPYANADIILYQYGNSRAFFFAKTDAEGNFLFEQLNIVDTTRFAITPIDPKASKNLSINVFGVNEKEEAIAKIYQGPPFLISQGFGSKENMEVNEAYRKYRGTTLKQVTITGNRRIEAVENSSNLNGAGKADAVVLAKDLETTHNLVTYLTNHIPGLKLSEGKIYSRDIPEKNVEFGGEGAFAPPPMLVIFDGMPVDQESFKIGNINPNDVASIEILKGTSAAMYGINGMGGVIIITQKRGFNSDDDPKRKSDKGIFSFSTIGYQTKREYYAPVYDIKTPPKYDFRKALYWNPSVITSKDKKTALSFFNSDYVGKFKVVLEGINADGQIGRAIYHYEVQ